MSKERIGKFIETQDQVIGAWLQYLMALGGFQCFSSDKQTVINETGVHIIDRKPRKCNAFCTDVECEDKTCSHKTYNTRIVYLFNELKKAKHERNTALLDLFFITRKIVQFREYKRLQKEEEAIAEDLYRCYDNGTLFTDKVAVAEKQAKWDVARELLWAARAKFLERKK